jgi:hypothetical protein
LFLNSPEKNVTLPSSHPAGFTIDVTKKAIGAQIKVKNTGDSSSVDSSELVFTGRIYFYFEDDISLSQLGSLDILYREKSMSPQFRGPDYAITKWLLMREETQ